MRDWAESGWLRSHTTSKEEIAGLLGIVERDLDDSRREIPADWRFGIAYSAALMTLHNPALCRRLPS